MRASDKSSASLAIDARNEIARLDMPIGLASFCRPFRPGSVRTAFICHQPWMDGVVSLRGIAPDDHALGVLLAVLVICEQQACPPVLSFGSEVDSLIVRGDSDSDNRALNMGSMSIATTYAEIRKLTGVRSDNAVNNKAIWESLQNLATITLDVRVDDGGRALTHLISAGKTKSNMLAVSLSYRLTRCVLGVGSYGAIDLSVFRALPRGSARILYVWLCSWYGGAFGERSIAMDKLVGHVFGESKLGVTQELLRNRRRHVRSSLLSISDHGWSFRISKILVFIIRHPLLHTRLPAVVNTPKNSAILGTTGETGVFKCVYKPSVLNRRADQDQKQKHTPPPHPTRGERTPKITSGVAV